MADTTQLSSGASATTSVEAQSEERESPDAIRECLDKANELKLEGNDLFKASRWNEALVSYRTALAQLPPRKRTAERHTDHGPSSEPTDADSGHEQPSGESTNRSASPEAPDELDEECSKARAVLYANIGACLLKLDDHKGVVDACTQALSDDPHYIKALQRRAVSGEKVDTWSSLGRAQEDYKLLLELLPAGSPDLARTKRALQVLEPRVQAAQKKETTEMMDKLKGLGNSILGNFGLSTNNFKFEPNGQGGYSMNFVQ
ncbi:hypothetical protein HYDPIDRAFT_106388, partial [Hydnomerulius pinastri MD-312]